MVERSWAELTPDEKRAVRLDRWRRPEVQFESPQAEADYRGARRADRSPPSTWISLTGCR